MTTLTTDKTTDTHEAETPVAPPPQEPHRPVAGTRRAPAWLRSLAVPVLAVLAALALFIVVALLQGATLDGLIRAFTVGVTGPNFLSQTLTRSIPLVLAALGVAIPARAGLVNVGAEGQLVAGAVAATGIGLLVGSAFPGPLSWLICCLAGAVAGALIALLCAALKALVGAPEAVTTLLLNFIVIDVMLFLLYQPWRDPNGSGQPQSRPLTETSLLPSIPGTRISIAVLVVVTVAIGIWWLASRTGWGFTLRVVGGNPDAARRSGLSIGRTWCLAMALGGALAGLGGALTLIGVEGQLRPAILTNFGFIAFLAAFVARGNIIGATVAGVVFAGLMVAGNPLQLQAGLDGSAVFVLLGLACLFLTTITRRKGASS